MKGPVTLWRFIQGMPMYCIQISQKRLHTLNYRWIFQFWAYIKNITCEHVSMWTCVNEHITYLQLMWNLWAIRWHTLRICVHTTFLDDLALQQRISAYFSVLLTFTNLTRNLLAYIVNVWQGLYFLSSQGAAITHSCKLLKLVSKIKEV